jgi:hypothetical protein
VGRRGGYPVEDPGDRQRRHGRGRELDRGDRDRIPPDQHPGLRHDEPGGQDERREDERVAGQRRRAAAVGRDPGHAGQRHGEPGPRDRADHASPEPDRHQRDQDRGTADEQGRVADAGTRDARVLQHDDDAVAERAPPDDGRRCRGTQVSEPVGAAVATAPPAAAGGEEHEQRRGQRESDDRQPTRVQPGEGELGQRHGGAPEQARRGERGKGEVTVGTHATNAPH